MVNISMHWPVILIFMMAIAMSIMNLFIPSVDSRIENVNSVVEQSLRHYKSSSPYTVVLLQKAEHSQKKPIVAAVIDHVEASVAENIIELHIPKPVEERTILPKITNETDSSMKDKVRETFSVSYP